MNHIFATETVEHRGVTYLVREPNSNEFINSVDKPNPILPLLAVCVSVDGVPLGDDPIPASLMSKLSPVLMRLAGLEADKGNG